MDASLVTPHLVVKKYEDVSKNKFPRILLIANLDLSAYGWSTLSYITKLKKKKKKQEHWFLCWFSGWGEGELHKPISQVTTSPFYFIGEKWN